MRKLIILDFDGTLTNAEEEGSKYRIGYLEDIALLADLPLETVVSWATEFEAHILANPSDFGWNFQGKIVAPASVDPYLRVMPIARMILDRAQVYTNLVERDRLLDRILYKYNYQKTEDSFREGAAAFFHNLSTIPNSTVCVVSNSHTEPIQKKIGRLASNSGYDFQWLISNVTGSARKYLLSDNHDILPESMSVPGLSRPMYLRRHLYHQTICSLQEKFQSDWEHTTVIGDIFELDLSVPLFCGAHVGLMTNTFTPQYEKDFLHQHPKGSTHASLHDAYLWLKNLSYV